MKPPIHKSSFSLPQSQESLLTVPPSTNTFIILSFDIISPFDGQKMLLATKHDKNVSTHSE